MLRLKYVACILLMGLLLFTVACGNNNNVDETNGDIPRGPNPAPEGSSRDVQTGNEIIIPPQWFAEEQVLTAIVSPSHGPLLISASRGFTANMVAAGIDFRFELIHYARDERDAFMIQLANDLAAGAGPDIIMLDDHALWALAPYLMDIYELLAMPAILAPPRRAIPSTSLPERLYLGPLTPVVTMHNHVLDAFTMDGRLLALPLNFGQRFVGVNANLPAAFINRFAEFETISMQELMDLYEDLRWIHNLGDAQWHMGYNFSPTIEILCHMGTFIDIDARAAQLTDPAFVRFLESLERTNGLDERTLFHLAGVGIDINSTVFHSTPSADIMAEQAQSAVFSATMSGIDTGMVWYHQRESHFVHYIPLVDSAGNLRLRDAGHYAPRETRPRTTAAQFQQAYGLLTMPAILVNANADMLLVREFIEQIMWEAVINDGGQTSNMWGRHSVSTPIRRDWAWFLEDSLRTITPRFAGRLDFERVSQDTQIENALARLAVYNEMPVAALPFLPNDVHDEIIHSFLTGRITAQETAEQLQLSVTEWMATLP